MSDHSPKLYPVHRGDVEAVIAVLLLIVYDSATGSALNQNSIRRNALENFCTFLKVFRLNAPT